MNACVVDAAGAAPMAVDPLVKRLMSTGALNVLSDAIFETASGTSGALCDFQAGWHRTIAERQHMCDTIDATDMEVEDVLCCGLPRINSASVEPEAAELCARLRCGNLEEAFDEGAEDAAVSGEHPAEGMPLVTVQALREALLDTMQPTQKACGPAPVPDVAPSGLSMGAVGGIFSLNELQMTALSILALAVGRSMLRDLGGADTDAPALGSIGMHAENVSGTGGPLSAAGQL